MMLEFSHHPVHYMEVTPIPWTTACEKVFHSKKWNGKLSATNDWNDVECEECLSKDH